MSILASTHSQLDRNMDRVREIKSINNGSLTVESKDSNFKVWSTGIGDKKFIIPNNWEVIRISQESNWLLLKVKVDPFEYSFRVKYGTTVAFNK